MKKAVAIGELLIDFVPQHKGCALDEVQQFERVAGGAPANVATAVARLGGEAKMISQVGEDAFGTHILKILRAANVDISSVFRTDRANTALAFVSLDAAGNREFSFYRNPSADLFLDEKQITPEMFENCAVLHFCSVDLVDYPVRGGKRLRPALLMWSCGIYGGSESQAMPAALEQSGGLSVGDTAVPALCGSGQAE